MRLKEVKIKNFRGYLKETTIPISECVTGITGKNDAGKSSILEALDIFFDGGEVTLDKDDFNVQSPDSPIDITCTFTDLPNEIILDETNNTSLSSEYLLNEANDLQIKKSFKKSSLKKPAVFLIASHPTADKYQDLHNLKITDLKKRAKELNVSDSSVADARASASWRKAIWASSQNLKKLTVELDIDEFDKDSKSIQEKIFRALPIFALFRSDRESKDSDPEAKNPLQEAVKQAQAELKEQIDKIQKEIQDRVLERAKNTLGKLREMDPTLADQLVPRFKTPPKWTFDFTIDGDGNVPVNKRGSGVRRLIILNFFRAEAERKVNQSTSPSVIYAIEEPETSQHPSNQEMLVRSLVELGNKKSCQVLVTTHVPALAGLLPTEGLRFIDKDEHFNPIIHFGTSDVLDSVCKSLGILPEFNATSAKGIILVEGPSDVTFMNHTCLSLKNLGIITTTLEEKRIYTVWVGGTGNLKHWQTKKVAEQFGIPWATFFDSDRGTSEEEKRKAQFDELKTNGKKAYLTRKRESENYLLPDIINANLKPEDHITYGEVDDAKDVISKAIKLRASYVLEKFWPLMSPEQIRQSEKYVENGQERYEFSEMIKDFLTLVEEP